MANTRVYYATQAVGLKPRNAADNAGTTEYYPKGVQSVGISTNFNLEQVFQLGQLEIYDNVENVPEVEVTLQKICDGSKMLYPLCVQGTGINADGKQVGEVSTNRVELGLYVFKDTLVDAFENQGLQNSNYGKVTCSGMYLSSVAYTIPVEGFITEDVTLVGNSKNYQNSPAGGAQPPNGGADAGATLKPNKIGRRINLSTESVLPTGAMSAQGVQLGTNKKGSIFSNERTDGGTGPYLQNINISMDLGREAIYELGKFSPYARYATFPIEVSSEFEVIAESHDQVKADDFKNAAACGTTNISNLDDLQIKIVICGSGVTDKYAIDLGSKNKLTSVNYSGGDTGGGNATITYSYQTFNSFKIQESGQFLSTSVGVVT